MINTSKSGSTMQQRSQDSSTPSSSIYSTSRPSNESATTHSTTSQRPSYLKYTNNSKNRPSVPERSANRAPASSSYTHDEKNSAPPPPPYETTTTSISTRTLPPLTEQVQTPPTLLLAVAATPSLPLIKIYVERLLRCAPGITSIALLGLQKHEVLFKQAKMEMYGLAGRLGREMGVRVFLRERLEEGVVEGVVGEVIVGNGEGLGAVVCFPRFGGRGDVLELSWGELVEGWRGSVGFVHAFGRSCLPRMTAGMGEGRAFFLTIYEDAREEDEGGLHLPAVEALMERLAKGFEGSVTVGRAEVVFPRPSPPPAEPVRELPRLDTGGGGQAYMQPQGQREDETPPESPSRLWSMWQMQDELGYAD